MKNFLIIVLFLLLVWVVTNKISHKQVIDLWSNTVSTAKELVNTNAKALSSENVNLSSLGVQNLSILKDYTVTSISWLLSSPKWVDELKKAYKEEIYKKYNISTYSELTKNAKAFAEYKEWIKQITDAAKK